MLTKKQARKLRKILINKFGWIFSNDQDDVRMHIDFLMELRLNDMGYNSSIVAKQGFLLERNGENLEQLEKALEILVFDEQLNEIVK